jgi:hypothetical protein
LVGRKIVDYTPAELDAVIEMAVLQVPRFWVLLRGIDAYFERRRRRKTADHMPFTEERTWPDIGRRSREPAVFDGDNQ